MNRWTILCPWIAVAALGLLFGLAGHFAVAQEGTAPADVILVGGRIVTVDESSTVVEAMAIRGDRIIAVGEEDAIAALAGPSTRRIELDGRMVLPGLIDSHTHSTGASTFEFDHEVPPMESIADVLNYVRQRASVLPAGSPIFLSQVFITRLSEQRFPTRQELDEAAPNHPVYFRTGPDASLNSLALKANGIDRNYQPPSDATGRVELDTATGEPTGIVRSAGEHVKMPSVGGEPSFEERCELLEKLLADYNRVGITGIADRRVSGSMLRVYEELKAKEALTCRAFLCWGIDPRQSVEKIQESIRFAAEHPTHAYDSKLWLRGIKVFLDGGMLTGSASMIEPWGVSKIYAIEDPEYRGFQYIEDHRLYEIAKLSLESGFQFTAHAVGDRAIETMVDTYRRIDENDFPVNPHRPCITHCNFLTPRAIDGMRELGIVADLQPAWLWLDGRTLFRQFGSQRLRYFQPYKTLFDQGVVVGGGSDHMQKIGSLRSVNPYDPWLGLWITLTRLPRGSQEPLHESEQLSREEALRLYTINNAYLLFDETNRGSLEVGKLADFIVIDRDYFACPVDEVREIQVISTWLGGEEIFRRK